MRRFRKPFYLNKRHGVLKGISVVVSTVYIVSTLIGIYMTSFGVGILPNPFSVDAAESVFYSPREWMYVERAKEDEISHSPIFTPIIP